MAVAKKEEGKEVPLTLYQKLLKIQQEVIGLGKDSKSFGYQYVSGSKVLEHVKPLMNQYGLLLKQEITDIENTREDYSLYDKNLEPTKHKSEILSKVMMKFTWVDCDSGDTDVNYFGANGQNDWEKGLGSALTYAERYFLLKFFHINTDEDDIDNPSRGRTTGAKMSISEDRFSKALSAIKAGTYSKEALTGAFELTDEQLKQLP